MMSVIGLINTSMHAFSSMVVTKERSRLEFLAGVSIECIRAGCVNESALLCTGSQCNDFRSGTEREKRGERMTTPC